MTGLKMALHWNNNESQTTSQLPRYDANKKIIIIISKIMVGWDGGRCWMKVAMANQQMQPVVAVCGCMCGIFMCCVCMCVCVCVVVYESLCVVCACVRMRMRVRVCTTYVYELQRQWYLYMPPSGSCSAASVQNSGTQQSSSSKNYQQTRPT